VSLSIAVLSLFRPPWPLTASGALNVGLIAAIIDYCLSLKRKRTSAEADQNAPANIEKAAQRQLIADGRKLIAAFNRQEPRENFVDFLAEHEEWQAIRPRLDAKVVSEMENPRLVVPSRDGKKDGKVIYLQDELDRLEREWGLI